MKKITIALMMLLGAIAANAQTWVGGGISLDVSKTDGQPDTRITFSPTIGYDFNDKWAIGMDLGYGYTYNEQNNSSETYHYEGLRTSNTNTFSVTPFVRYTFAQAGIVSFFVDGFVAYNHIHSNINEKYTALSNNVSIPKDREQTSRYNELNIGLRPGVAFNINDHISLVSSIGSLTYYHNSKNGEVDNTPKDNLKSKTDGLRLRFANSINVGMVYKF